MLVYCEIYPLKYTKYFFNVKLTISGNGSALNFFDGNDFGKLCTVCTHQSLATKEKCFLPYSMFIFFLHFQINVSIHFIFKEVQQSCLLNQPKRVIFRMKKEFLHVFWNQICSF